MSNARIALLIETSNAYARGVLEGVTQYIHEHGPWSVYLPERGRGDVASGWLRGWKGDGILARAENPRIARVITATRLPTVDLSAAGFLPRAPWVHSDVRAEAAAAFNHLWDRGFRRLGFCGVSNYRWSRWQCEEFTRLAQEAGCDCDVFEKPLPADSATAWAAEQRSILQWVNGLTKPVGVFACYDIRGQQVLEACRAAGKRVPDDVAVIGVDNDPVRCGLSDPPLSSVIPDTRRVGYQAAELLDAIMNGRRIKPAPYLIAPLGVVTRKSTDALAIDDADVSAAARFIRDHACEPIGVKHVLRSVPISRRALERRFLGALGRTPHQEILRCRIDKARLLLSTTDLPIKAIAQRVGVGNAEYLSVIFKKMVGSTPASFRQQHMRGALQRR